MAATYGRWAVRGGSRGGGERRAEVVDGARWYETPLRGRWGGSQGAGRMQCLFLQVMQPMAGSPTKACYTNEGLYRCPRGPFS
jgi:hypothetical protein